MNSSLKNYTIGFALSIFLTLLAYYITANQLHTGNKLIAAIIVLAFVQALVQLFFFLHIGQETKPRWNFMVFLSTVFVILIVIGGTIWIMTSLNYRHSKPHTETTDYIFEQEAIPK